MDEWMGASANFSKVGDDVSLKSIRFDANFANWRESLDEF